MSIFFYGAIESESSCNYNRPYIGSKITEKPVYVTPYYVPTGIKALHDTGFKGKGVKLGIIDGGINFKINIFEGNYVYDRKFVNVDCSQTKDSSECNRRSVGLAGIAVAKANYFTGVAPEATLGTYCVFGCTGPASASIVLQAIKTTVHEDQMKIIVLPEIAIVDEASTQLRQEIKIAARQGVIMIVAASANDFIKQKQFSYKGLPVLSVGGARQDYHLSHWFEEKTTGRRIKFISSCSNMKYNFDNEMAIIPNNFIGTLNEHFNRLNKGGIALVWHKTGDRGHATAC
ncbi:peptidase S8/S53 domain-containing protein [Syncephalis fuscata]|nr:peptidase S8/S53 domain-containing protein [Syncephalis fuscata]